MSMFDATAAIAPPFRRQRLSTAAEPAATSHTAPDANNVR